MQVQASKFPSPSSYRLSRITRANSKTLPAFLGLRRGVSTGVAYVADRHHRINIFFLNRPLAKSDLSALHDRAAEVARAGEGLAARPWRARDIAHDLSSAVGRQDARARA